MSLRGNRSTMLPYRCWTISAMWRWGRKIVPDTTAFTRLQPLRIATQDTRHIICESKSKSKSKLRNCYPHNMAPLSLTTFRPLSRSIQSTRSRPLAQIQTNRFSTTRTQRQGQNLSDVSVTDRMSLKGRNIFITGGGRGIGFAITKAVAQLGGNIAVVDALPEPVEEFHSLGSKYGAKTFYQKADVTNQSSIESAFKNAVSEVGEFEGCVPAAGIALDKPVFEHGWDESVRVLMVNTMGTFWTAKLVADHMKQHGKGGSIVMIASVAAQGIKVSRFHHNQPFLDSLLTFSGPRAKFGNLQHVESRRKRSCRSLGSRTL